MLLLLPATAAIVLGSFSLAPASASAPACTITGTSAG
jgi:hypothetical protein